MNNKKESVKKLKNAGTVIINSNGAAERHLPIGFRLEPSIEKIEKENVLFCSQVIYRGITGKGKIDIVPKKGAERHSYSIIKSEHII